MDVVNFIFSAENLRTLFLFVAMVAGFVWLDQRQNGKIDASEGRLREEMNGLGAKLRQEMNALEGRLRQEIEALRQEMNALAATLRKEMDERFTAFHKTLKENDFEHLHETLKAMTFTMHKNGLLDPEDKKFIDSHLDK